VRFLSKRETSLRVDLSEATITRRAGEGTFPKPVDLGGNRVAFVEDEVEQWIADRMAARDAPVKAVTRHTVSIEAT
jgi:prophage regulatory protein